MKRFIFLLGLIILVFLASLSLAEIPKLINYQGMLTDDEGTPLDGPFNMIFRIYTDPTSTNPIYFKWDETHGSVQVTKGLFNVILGNETVGGIDLDFSEDYWLEVQVDDDTMPRIQFTSVGYAFKALESDTADFAREFSGTAENADKVDGLHASSTPTANYLYPLDGSSKIPNARLYTGSGNGLDADLLDGHHAADFISGGTDYGRSGVAANLYEGTSTLTGKYVNVTGPDSVTGSDITYPMLLVKNNSGRYALRAEGYRSSTIAVQGIYSLAQNTGLGPAFGGHFETSDAGTGYHSGVHSESFGASNNFTDGITSYATNTSSGDAVGGYFKANSSGSGEHYGVYAESYSTSVPSNHCYGVYGSAENTSSGWALGGTFYASAAGTGLHYGIWVDSYGNSSTETVTSVYGFGQNTSSAAVYAGHFEANSSGSGTHFGVYGYEAAGGGGAAVYAAGDYAGSGTKSAVVKTSKGHRLLSVIESPEIWFEDFGEGQLLNGRAHIELDPLFLETVTINAQHPMKVFVQVEDENCKGTAVKRGITGFDVIELNGGMSNAFFSYRVVAKRRGYETERLRETDVGYDDPTLYPELREEMERRHEERKLQHELRAEERRQQEDRIKEGP
jgi:hypothetical protein